jgi:hypothetical protein
MPTTLDMMEYATDAAAQAAYPSSGAEFVDQSCDTGATTYNFGDLSDVEYRRAQSFQTSGPLYITALETKEIAAVNTPVGNWDFRIETDSGGSPSGSLVSAGATVTVVPPGAGLSVKGTFASPILLAAGTTYWFVLSCANQTTNKRWNLCCDNTAPYPYASKRSLDGVWEATTTSMTFRVYARTPLECFSESAIKVEGAYSLKGYAKITAALNQTLTRTVTPTVNLSGLDCLWLYIYASRTGANIKIGFHDSGGTTTEITPTVNVANTWQMVALDLSAVADANKDAIDSIIVTITNADAANTFYLDCIFADDYPQYLIDRPRSRVRRRPISAGE